MVLTMKKAERQYLQLSVFPGERTLFHRGNIIPHPSFTRSQI